MRTQQPVKPASVKSATAFRTISEVASDLDVPQHVLRFWESKFPQIRPLKRGGGRRYYRPEDVDLLRRIQSLLHREGYTIKGVQRLLKDGRSDLPPSSDGPLPGDHLDPEAAVTDETADDAPPEEGAVPEPAAAVEALPDHVRQEIALAIKELKALRELLRELSTETEISLI
jgi:DNA-binding transcriptional MerR regulator